MVAKKTLAFLLSASLVLGMCPLPRVAYATETIAGEGQLDSLVLVNDDAESTEADTEEGISLEVPVDDVTQIEEVTDDISVDDDAVQVLDESEAPLSTQSDDDSTPEGEFVSPEPTVWQQSDAALPSKFDLRDRGVVTPVKSQDPWGDCWAHAAIAAAETSILTAMGSTYAKTGLDLSERHLAWYVTSLVPETVSKSQAGEGLIMYNTAAGANHVFDFGGREQCAATLFAQGIGPMPESEYPNRGANGTLASADLAANKEAYIQQRIQAYKDTYWYYNDTQLRTIAESEYSQYVRRYQQYDAYSPLDDWSITESDEPGSGRLKGSAYTLTDNNVFNYWASLNDDGVLDPEFHFHKQPLYATTSSALWQDSIDQLKTEIYEGRGIAVGVTISNTYLNTDTWSQYDPTRKNAASHEVCIVGWDDDYDASNFTETPPGNGAWIVKNSWGSETDAVAGGLTASDGTTKDAHGGDWGIEDENGKHTGYFYLSYYDGTIVVPESFSFSIEPNNDQRDALQLDFLPASVAEFFHVDENPTWEANVFTLEKDMRIDEVAARIRLTNKAPFQGFTCKFDLYKLRDGATKPDDGKLVSTVTRTFQMEGYHRTALDAPVYLKAGDRLGIVVQQTHIADDGVTLYGFEAQECDGYRTLHSDPVYGTAIVNEGESFYNIQGITDKDESSNDGWLDVMAPLTQEMLLHFKPDLANSPNLLDYYITNYVGKPMQDFFNIDNFGIKAFGEQASLKHVSAVAPTCDKAGSVEYWRDSKTGVTYADENGTKVLKSTTKAALGHKWGKATYKWSKSNSTCTATRTCTRNKAHKQTAKAKVTSKVTKSPTAAKAGVRTYTATFSASWAKKQTKTAAFSSLGIPVVLARAHVQNKGWTPYIASGKVVGSTGKSRRMKAFRIKIDNAKVSGGIEYRGHVQGIGWEKTWSRDGKMSGAQGKAKRVEAVQIRLYGQMAKTYDVYYRVHSQNYGWMGWAKNGAKAGTSGKSLRAEAMQIVLVAKGAKAPANTYKGVKRTYAKAFV